ncbi:MAG: RluA family pseudouridine synthase [Hyphomicrobiales bacterium]|nr:RluA family pseudouridine synthase [Hyphomicrobiales bacterium]
MNTSVNVLSMMATQEARGERLDRVLARNFAEFSRARLQALIREGAVRIGKTTASDPSLKLRGGEKITLAVPQPRSPEPQGQDIPLSVLYEDAQVIVIDKPAGLVVHPAAGHVDGTLVNALIAHCGESLSGIGGVKRPGIVHRLDKDTSGLMVIAKTDKAHHSLAAQFADHGREGPLEREYQAFVWGRPRADAMRIDRPVGRSPHHRQRMAVVAQGRGKEALTHLYVEESFPPQTPDPLASRLRCRLETGRTHQIRVHLSSLGHPLLGDPLYGGGFRTKINRLDEPSRAALRALGRQALHASLLGFAHPVTGRKLRFESGLPPPLAALETALRSVPNPSE